MDCIDRALYKFEGKKYDNLPEATRRAFLNLFDPKSDDAMLVMKYLIGVLRYEDFSITNDGIINSTALALHNVMLGIKKQLNMNEIELETTNE